MHGCVEESTSSREGSHIVHKARADVIALVLDAHFAGDDVARLLGALAPPQGPDPKRRRRATQVWGDALLLYFTEKQWESLKDMELPGASKLDMIIRTALNLGLRCPAEPTLKLMASLWMLCSEPDDVLTTMNRFQKLAMYQHVKGTFDTARKRAADPLHYITELPPNAVDYMQLYPEMYTAVFRDASPCQPQVHVAVLNELNDSYGCRGGNCGASAFSRVQQRAVAPQMPLQLNTNPGLAQLERMAGLILERMQCPQPALFRGQSLVDLQPPVRRQPTLEFGHQMTPATQLALPAPPSVPATPQPKVRGDQLALLTPSPQPATAGPAVEQRTAAMGGQTMAVVHEQPPPTTGEQPTSPSGCHVAKVGSDVADMLDMLGDRDTERTSEQLQLDSPQSHMCC